MTATTPASARRTLLLATGNAKKGNELRELALGFDVLTLKDVGLDTLDIVEDGDTFAANARKKVDAVAAALTPERGANVFVVLGDDSGLAVDALDGKPGVRSARFALDHGTGSGDAANNALLLLLMAPVPEERRSARFVCHIHALRLDNGARADAFGTVEGRLARVEDGAGGFGYDPLFLPNDANGKTMAQLSSDEKHAMSHRGHAMRAILKQLAAM